MEEKLIEIAASSFVPTISNAGVENTKDSERDGQNLSSKQSAREDYISWEVYFMSVAILSAKRSKDPSTQVGACIVNSSNRIVGIGYNGFARGCSDDIFPWNKHDSDPLQNKYLYVVHAEVNAIVNKNSADVEGCRIFVTLFPCNECAKLIIQSGISEIIYLGDKNMSTPSCIASLRMFAAAHVTYRKFESSVDHLDICLTIPSFNDNDNKI